MRKLRRVVLCVLLGASAASATSAAFAEPKGKDKADKARVETPVDVETAEQLYTKLDYDKANETAERVIKQRGLSHDQLVRAYRILAVTYAILDKEEQARDAFLHLLVSDPEYTIDTNLGPKVSTPFVEARGQFRSLPSKPGMEVVANVRSDGGQLRITTRDPTRIAKKVTVGYRWTSSGEYTVSTVPVGEATVEVAPATQGRTRLDFYATALDERDNAVFEAGSPQVPKSAFAEASARPIGGNGTGYGDKGGEKTGGSVLSSPVFWIIAGAVVAGGGTAAFFAFRPEEAATRASLAPQIRCGAELCK